MTKPVILQMGPYPQWDEQPLNEAYTVYRYFDAEDTQALIAEHGAEIRAIATRGNIGASAELINSLPNLEIVSVFGVGFDAVNLEACAAKDVRVTNTPDVLTKDVADLAIAMMLAQGRGIVQASNWVHSGDWKSKGDFALQKRMHAMNAGILGLGRIGYEVARRLVPFDMDIAYSDRAEMDHGKKQGWTFIADPVELAKRSDVLIVACAATPETRHIVNNEVIEALGPDGMVVNVSRASNIDEDALLDGLESGKLGSAALDVFEGEPALNERFLKLSNVLLQPHHASGTVATRKDMGQLMRDNLSAHFAGKPLITKVQ